jgi:hypothetical protein
MAQSSWLFIRNGESVWIERPHGFTLIVAGPGAKREDFEFPHERALDAFQASLAERLANDGWFLWAYDRDRREGRERRQSPRTTNDRRKPVERSR